MSARLIDPVLVAARRARLQAAVATAPFDAVLALGAANVDYATGYRSVSAAVHGSTALAAAVSADALVVAGPVAESAPGFAAGLEPDDYLAFGRFYYESPGGTARATQLVDQHPDQAAAVAAAVRRLRGVRRLGLDERSCPAPLRARLDTLLPDVELVDASAWLTGVRAVKLPGEVALLERAARVVEGAMLAGAAAAGVGVTEAEIAGVVVRELVASHLEPRFVVVTSGERSALSDAYATARPLRAGDLLRFDVGGMLEGYWADLGRTAVLGEPTARQRTFYDALLAGEQAQLDLARPGVSAAALFDRAVQVVEGTGGPLPYRRHHCGHGIGLDAYEPPIVQPGVDTPLQEGMTFCFETPYYELGWGGMMVEDALVVTADGVRTLSDRGRDLHVVPL